MKSKKKILITSSIFLLVIAGLGLYLFGGNMDEFSNRIPEVKKSQFIEHPKDWRNLRYAEIVPVFRSGGKFYVEVYNTIGSNECPQDLWDKLNADKLAKAYGAEKVILNGPRYWTLNQLDERGVSSDGKIANFGGIEMTQRATMQSNIFTGTVGSKFYTENAVQRETTFHYWKNNRVYELISPEGGIYRMQSYCTIRDKSLSINNLEQLAEKLQLPEGWEFKTYVLNQNEELIANGIAYVINDNLGNSYQKVNP